MKVLHILRSLNDERALNVAVGHQQQGHQVTLLLFHDAVLSRPAFTGTILANREDVEARGRRCPYPTVDYDEALQLLFEHDRVVSW